MSYIEWQRGLRLVYLRHNEGACSICSDFDTVQVSKGLGQDLCVYVDYVVQLQACSMIGSD